MFPRERVFLTCLTIFSFLILSPCSAQDTKPVTINFWHLAYKDDYQAMWKGICDDFAQLHPNVTFNITVLENEVFRNKVADMMQAGTPPDIFINWGGDLMIPYAKAGLLRDITTEYKTWPTTVSAVDMCSYKGKIYGLPYDIGSVGFWYNKDLLKKVGYSSFPVTWNGFLELVKKLKAAGITPIALGEGDKWPGHFWWVYLAMRIGGRAAFDKAYSGEGSFADEPWVKAGEMLKQLVAGEPFQKGFLSDGYVVSETLMGTGQAAMILMGQWSPAVSAGYSEDNKGLGDKLGFANFPAVENGAGALTDCMGGGNGLVLGKDAPDEAVAFLKYVTSVEVQKRIVSSRYGGIPTVPGAEDALSDPRLEAVAEAVAAADYFQLYYDIFLPTSVGQTIHEGTYGIFAGTITPEQCAWMVDDAYKKSHAND